MKTSMFPRAFVFDWDNTLIDSWGAISAAINHVRGVFDLKIWSPDEIKKNCTRAARESFPEWFGVDWQRAYKIYYDEFDRVRKSREITVMPGAAELLAWIKSHEIPAYVVSNKRGDLLRIEAERLGWSQYFVSIIGAQDAQFDKPHRAHVDHAMSFGNDEPGSHVWFVGDSETDMLCAHNSGCTAVLVGEDVDPSQFGVALAFGDCDELLATLREKLGRKT